MGDKKGEISANRYTALIEKIFFDRYSKKNTIVEFERNDFAKAAKALGIVLPKNLGDVIYSIRYRTALPDRILATEPKGMEWIIEGAGRSHYIFKLVKINKILPDMTLVQVKIPDATPEIISAYSLSDEQALLAKVRYNRLVDIFLGITAYSMQNHLRTTVVGIGQIEIDEIYVGIDKFGRQFVLPVQAKGGNDKLSAVQAKQDIKCCAEKFPHLICRSISSQFIEGDLIALFELTIEDDQIKKVDERHYRLVPAESISSEDLQAYKTHSHD